jgi:hypothetical protein
MAARAAAQIQISITWIGPSGQTWSGTSNWNPNAVGGARNVGNVGFSVAIPQNTPIFDLVTPATINGLSVGSLAGIQFTSGLPHSLTVVDPARVNGAMDMQGNSIMTLQSPPVSLDDGRFIVANGAVFSASSGSVSYSSKDFWSATIMSADGAGSTLDLRAIRNLSSAFDDYVYEMYVGWYDHGANTQTVRATNGGIIDLAGLYTATPPVRGNDTLNFLLDGAASSIRLSGLTTINMGAAGGVTLFSLSNAATLDLPVLRYAGNTRFDLDNATLTLPSVETFTNGIFTLRNASRLTANTSTADYSSAGLWTATIMSADGPGSILDLSGMRSLSATFNDYVYEKYVGWYDHGVNVQSITATNGGMVNLQNLTTITAPVQGNDRVEIVAGTASGNSSTIDLSSLHTLSGGGETRFIVNGNSTLRLGYIYHPSASSITVNDSARLEAVSSLRLGSAISLNAHAGTQIDINGRFSYAHQTVANMNLSDGTITGGAIVTMHGGGQKVMEVGGVDYGTATFLLNDGNFGMGRLVVGVDGQPTDVTLFDLANNGRRAGGFESLYLFGNAGQDGLAIKTGSKLVLNDLNVYVNIGGTFTNLKDVIPPGQGSVAFDQGYIVLHNLPSTPADVNGDGRVTGADIDLERDAIAGASPQRAWFDTNDDQDVNSADLNYLLVDLLHTKAGDANLDGMVDLLDLYQLATHYHQFGDLGWGEGDFNADFVVDARDLGDIARNWQYGVAGPAMSFTEALAAIGAGTSVPEPASSMIIGSMLATLLPRRRRVQL